LKAQQQNSGTGVLPDPVTPFSPIALPGTNTTVTGEFDGIAGAGVQGVAIVADPSNCSGCRWIQIVTAEGHTFTDVPIGNPVPLYNLTGVRSNELKDHPYRGGSVRWSAVSVVGDANIANKTFHARGAITWGFSIDSKGNLSVRGPVPASQAQQTQAIQQAKKEYPEWTY